ncbi:MAG: HAD-IC family P-type ATPase [Actinomycetota bacterium]|nr:HAD-IC family P-type ATPase [Actinomycetota bacterium]
MESLQSALRSPGRRRRRVWSRAGRAHVEVRGLGPGADAVGRGVEDALRRLDGVRWAEANQQLGRVAVAFDGGRLEADDLVRVVTDTERALGVGDQRFPTDRPDHPADSEPLIREAVALGVDVAALGLAVAGRAAQMARLPLEVAGLVPLVQSQPRLRQVLESQVGPAVTGLGLSVTNAAAQAMAQGPLGLVVDLGHHLSLLSESVARQRVWAAREEALHPGPGVRSGQATAAGPATGERPLPLPPGPAEAFSQRAGLASLAALGATLLASGRARRAVAALLAVTPKGAVLGPDAFAAQLGWVLAKRGILCLDADALRRLDRVDCLVLDADVVCTGAVVVDRVIALGGADHGEVRQRAVELFDGMAGGHVRRVHGWALGPVRAVGADTANLEVRRHLRNLEGEDVLGLTHEGSLVGLVRVEEELDGMAASLVEAARHSEQMVAVAGGDLRLVERLGADLLVDGGPHLYEAVRSMQADGCVVALISATNADALQAADCGIGVTPPSGAVSWTADLLCGSDLADAHLVVEAMTVAHEVSRQSAALALAGSSLAAPLALTGPPGRAAGRALNTVNVAALLAMANGVRAALLLARRPEPLPRLPPAWHEYEVDEALGRLGSSWNGLSAAEAASRSRHDQAPSLPSLPSAVLEELANPLTPVLGGAAALSTAVGAMVDGVIIGAVVMFNAGIGGVQRYRVARAIHQLEQASSQQVRARRDGDVVLVPAETLVSGDVVLLASGDSVPADCRILSSSNLEVDESSLTGESMPVAKAPQASFTSSVAERTSMLYEATSVAAGVVEAVVVATGRNTEAGLAKQGVGRLASGVEGRLTQLTRTTLPVSAAGGAGLAAVGMLRGASLSQSLHSGVSLAVAAVPEGLPLLATMAQLSSARRLSERGALVRNHRSIEALGRVDLLCCDKTGTLTEGRIELQSVFDGETEVPVDDLTAAAAAVVAAGLRASPLESAGDDPLPHLTDRAVVRGAAEAGVDAATGIDTWERRAELPFEPARGYHAVLGGNGSGFQLSVKGAPEVVLPRCVEWQRPGGSAKLDQTSRARMAAAVDELARRGARILAVAERSASSRADLHDDRVRDLRLIGFLALSDPVRPEAASAVRGLQGAGVDIVMLTGDHPSTAEGVASELGILNGRRVVTGPELDELDDDHLDRLLPDVSVFARVTPSHKVRLVLAYQRHGKAVAMTGDGANDAPAIRLADVGVALGENSTSAARGAADLLVLDGRIETIIDAIVEGRAMWVSVREAIAILLGGNLGETVFTVVASAVSGRPALSPRQLLIVNLLTDVVPALTIAVRQPARPRSEDLMTEGPEASLGRALERAILARAISTAAGAGAGWVGARLTGRGRRASTVALVALVGSQLGQTMLAGGRNPAVVVACAGSAALLVGLVQTPGVSQFFGCTPLGPGGWAIAGASAAAGTASSLVTPRLLARRAPRLRPGTA